MEHSSSTVVNACALDSALTLISSMTTHFSYRALFRVFSDRRMDSKPKLGISIGYGKCYLVF
jgi:hypothetical protein